MTIAAIFGAALGRFLRLRFRDRDGTKSASDGPASHGTAIAAPQSLQRIVRPANSSRTLND